MDKPTCRTCPFWDLTDAHFDLWDDDPPGVAPALQRALSTERTVEGECRRFPRSWQGKGVRDEQTTAWPFTADYDWCGEHPDFPAWLASRKTAPATRAVRVEDVLSELDRPPQTDRSRL